MKIKKCLYLPIYWSVNGRWNSVMTLKCYLTWHVRYCIVSNAKPKERQMLPTIMELSARYNETFKCLKHSWTGTDLKLEFYVKNLNKIILMYRKNNTVWSKSDYINPIGKKLLNEFWCKRYMFVTQKPSRRFLISDMTDFYFVLQSENTFVWSMVVVAWCC